MTTIFPDRLADLLKGLPQGDEASARAVAARQARLTKPAGSLGMLEEGVAWLPPGGGRGLARSLAGPRGAAPRSGRGRDLRGQPRCRRAGRVAVSGGCHSADGGEFRGGWCRDQPDLGPGGGGAVGPSAFT